MENAELIKSLNTEMEAGLSEKISYDEIQGQLAIHINNLIMHDFDKLVAYLYRIDVSEEKLKLLLQQLPQKDAGKIIAALIIERQQQKIKTRQQFSKRENGFNEEEKW
ncbi:MAG: hypothetical protein ABI666_08680 [Ferruginibacter sp.]